MVCVRVVARIVRVEGGGAEAGVGDVVNGDRIVSPGGGVGYRVS